MDSSARFRASEEAATRPADSRVDPTATTGEAPGNLTIVPTPAPGNDQTIEFDWEVVAVETNRSLLCTVSSSQRHGLSVTIQQGAHQRTVEGRGVVRVPAIPVAPSGTKGQLSARDTVTGATSVFSWEWEPGSASTAPGSAPARGLLSRLFGRSKPVAPTGGSVTVAETAADRARRLGGRAADGIALRFFDQEVFGQRFAFIIDTSGSMWGPRWDACMRELERAFFVMPDRIEFFLVLFASTTTEPPEQRGWAAADRNRVETTIRWLDTVAPGGGTYPRPAFERVFALPDPPDVIYFLTDGELAGFSASDCAAMRGSRATIVNTISLETQASVTELEEIASQSGGSYRHIPSVGRK